MVNNPYTLIFGQEPNQMIPRTVEFEEVTKNFESTTQSQMIYMITGLRGSGKTVFMTEIEDYFATKKEWITVNLSSESDLLKSLVSKLSSDNTLAVFFKKEKIDLSFFGFGLEVRDAVPITNIETALTKMMESIKKSNKKLLVTIDEVINNKSMREFASVYQMLIRNKLPIYLLMAGLYENINELQNEKNLTFLYRTPRIVMRGLNIREISNNYSNILNLSASEAIKMAGYTNGYPFAFQVLGHFTWDHNGDYMSSMAEYKDYLYDYVYDKIWLDASGKDKMILYAIAKSNSDKIVDIRKVIDIDTNNFNPYKKRLKNRGLIDGDTYGRITFILPLFKEYVLENYA